MSYHVIDVMSCGLIGYMIMSFGLTNKYAKFGRTVAKNPTDLATVAALNPISRY